MRKLSKKYINNLTYEILGAAIDIHNEIGPGLLEKVYETCMVHELNLRGLKVTKQQNIPINYKGVKMNTELRYDILVDDLIVVELKAVQELHPLFEAQAISYAKLLGIPKAILLNFKCNNIFNEGQKTFVTEAFRRLPEE